MHLLCSDHCPYQPPRCCGPQGHWHRITFSCTCFKLANVDRSARFRAGPVQLGLASLGSAVAQWILLSGAMLQAGFPIAMQWGGHAAGTLFKQLIGTASPVLLTTCALHGAAWTDLAVASYVPGTQLLLVNPVLLASTARRDLKA